MLKLRYHGFLPALVTVNDNPSAVFNEWVYPGQTFTVRGRVSGTFAGNFITILLNGIILNATIKVDCTLQFDPSTFFGLFTIVSAESKNGGVMCCTSNTGPVTPPEIFGCPTDVAALTATNCNAQVTWTEPAAPSCDVVSFTSSHAPGSTFPIGVTRVTYTAKNSANLTSTCSFNITVTDGTPPTVVKATPDVTVNAAGDCKAAATWSAPQFADNCTLASVSSSHSSGSLFPLGVTPVTYTARDEAGNTKTFQFKVTVKDTTPPVVASCPADITVQTATGCSTAATWTPPTFTDACSSVSVTASHSPGAVFNTGNTAVTYTAKDASGNTTVCTFNVFVKDQNFPLFAACPPDTTIATTAVGGIRYAWVPPTATDECSEPVVTSTHQPGDLFPLGISTVVYSAKDAAGNVSTCSFVVNVKPEQTKLDVAQLITPDGNTVNDAWIIGNIELYPENKVIVVDRWGSVVYTETGYDNENRVWRGRNAQGNIVPSGTYFYTITVRSGNQSSETRGFIEVVK